MDTFSEWHTKKRKMNWPAHTSSFSPDHPLSLRFSIPVCLPTFPIFNFILDV